MKVLVYGALRDYFDASTSLENVGCLGELIDIMLEKSPAASAIINECRVVLNKRFIEKDRLKKLNATDILLLFPPSSGG